MTETGQCMCILLAECCKSQAAGSTVCALLSGKPEACGPAPRDSHFLLRGDWPCFSSQEVSHRWSALVSLVASVLLSPAH